MGNITEIREKPVGSTTFSTKITYTYDQWGQLVRENNVDLNKTIVYTYDAGGNITKRTEYPYTTGTVGTATKTVNYTYDTAWKDQLKKYGSQSIIYDNIGNPKTYRDGMSFTWQGRQMKTANLNGTSVSYKYNADGLRTYKKVGSTVHEYEYSGGKLFYEKRGDVKFYFRYDALGNLAAISRVNPNGNMFHVYVICNSRGDVEELREADGGLYARYIYDSWGNLIHIYDANGAEITSSTALAVQNPIRYRGYYFDAESGLYYLQSRYYDPVTCRFLNADGQLNDDIIGINVFAYCSNNPVARADNNGYAWETVFDIISLGASIIELCVNPTDLWSWAGVIGDLVDVAVPFVAGIGESVDAIKTVKGFVEGTDDVVDAAKTVKKATSKATGSYEIVYESGKNYIGKGGFDRAITSAIEHSKPNELNNMMGDTVKTITWKSAPSNKQAFIDEYLWQKARGGVLSFDKTLNTYNKIWSPGRNFLK